MRRQPFILLSFSSSKKARKAQETQSYQRFQHIGHTDFKGLSNAVTNTHPLLPSMGTTRQKSSCRNRLQNGPHSLLRMKVGTHSPLPTGSHTAAHRAKHGAIRMGVVSLLSERSARSPTSPGRVSERQVLPLLGLGRGCSQKTQKAFGTAMRLCASLFRGVAAPLGCVICLQLGDVAVFSLCAQYFLNVRGGGGITTLGAFHTVRKPCVAGAQNSKLCRFLRSGGHH